MVEINWQQDYRGDFICPSCEKSKLSLNGFNHRGERRFTCPSCKSITLASLKLISRSRYLASRLKDEYIDWEKDYHGEFVCPECGKERMLVQGINKKSKKRIFRCSRCRKRQYESHNIEIKKVEDPLNPGIYWYANYRIQEFICPNCQEENIYLVQIDKWNKKIFQCRTCQKYQSDSIILSPANLSQYSDNPRPLKPFQWTDDKWDLRAINPNFDNRDTTEYFANFTEFEFHWFKERVKQYIYHMCQLNRGFQTIKTHLSSLRLFSRYLVKENVSEYHEINRSLILDYLSKEKKVTSSKLRGLRDFFTIGTIKGWFNIDQDIIRDADYPKQHYGNPDPLSDTIRQQIEENLHLLPEPIARMWLIGYFAAMRPSELAFLKQDCLVQEGQHWKLVWNRKKGKDQHEIPISRTIAKVVQEQQEYIKNLWGDEWDYLFCHYHGLSSKDPFMPKLEPVKQVLPTHYNPLLVGIRNLITVLDIRDENGQPPEFVPKLLRPTRLTELFNQGHDLAVVSAWAGHKQFATTSTYYTQVSCELMEREAGHIQRALVNSNGHRVLYESFPKSFWDNPTAHKLELDGTHINTPIYGYCGLPLDQDCHKFRACYTCQSFVATLDKLPQYINTRDELRAKQAKAISAGQEVLVEQFGTQADRLDRIIASLQQEAA